MVLMYKEHLEGIKYRANIGLDITWDFVCVRAEFDSYRLEMEKALCRIVSLSIFFSAFSSLDLDV